MIWKTIYFHFHSFEENVNVSTHCRFFVVYLVIAYTINKKKAKEKP